MKIVNLHEPVFKTRLLLLIGGTWKEAERYFADKDMAVKLRGCSGQMGSYQVRDKDGSEQTRYYIFAEKEKDIVKKLRTLCHEISHLVFAALYDCHIEINRNNDETFAYYFDWWLGSILGASGEKLGKAGVSKLNKK